MSAAEGNATDCGGALLAGPLKAISSGFGSGSAFRVRCPNRLLRSTPPEPPLLFHLLLAREAPLFPTALATISL